jgi:hypothetical protein
LQSLLWSRKEVWVYQWCGSTDLRNGEIQLEPLALHHLASAVMENVDEAETLDYLLRSTRRLRSKQAEGFVLVDRERRPLHFAWLKGFDGSLIPELKSRVEASAEDVLIFDCWTPVALRGRGYCAQALQRIAHNIAATGRNAWVVSAQNQPTWLRALAKAGFQQQYSLCRKSVLWIQRVIRCAPSQHSISGQEASARV